MCLTNSIILTSVGINTISTIMLLTLTTKCDGVAPVTTHDTHMCLISSLFLRGGWVAFISPNMMHDMVPWSMRTAIDLPPNAKLCEMQETMHGVVQLIRVATPTQLSKQLLNVCPIPPMHIVVQLPQGRQNSIFPSK